MTMDEVVKYLESKTILGVDSETEGWFNHNNKMIMLQIGDFENQFVFDLRTYDASRLKPILENPKITKVLQNAKFDYKFFKKDGINLTNIWDTQLAEMVLTTGLDREVNLGAITQKYLNITLDKSIGSQFVNLQGKPFTQKQIQYGADDIKGLLKIKEKQDKELDSMDLQACLRLENKFVSVLADIEYSGFYLDKNRWKALEIANREKLLKNKAILDNYIIDNDYSDFIDYQYDMFNEGFTCNISWDSPMQVIKFLKVLGVNTSIKDKKTGETKNTCEEKTMRKYIKHFPFLKLYFNYKETAKEISTYGEKFLQNINIHTGRVHSSYWQIVSTGRISSSKPNLQNIPSKEEFRSCFRAQEGNTLIVADYSQQEPRVTADKCKDPYLMDFILNGDGDSHSLISTMISNYLLGEQVKVSKTNNPFVPKYNSKIRDVGKMINLGLDYGKSAYTLKDDLDTSEDEAQKLIDIIKEKTPEKEKYFAKVYKESIQNGYILIDDITKRKSFSDDFHRLKSLQRELDASKNNGRSNKFDWKDYYKTKGEIQRRSQNYPILYGTCYSNVT